MKTISYEHEAHFCSKLKNKLRALPALTVKKKLKSNEKEQILNLKRNYNFVLIPNDGILVSFQLASKTATIPRL